MNRGDDHSFGGSRGALPPRPFPPRVDGREEVAGRPLPSEDAGLGPRFGEDRWREPAREPEESPADDEPGPAEGGRRRRGPEVPKHPRHHVALLGQMARVFRDPSGVPHISANNERDAYAALGFCMALDAPWALEQARRRALGRCAEIEGEKKLGSDLLLRLGGVARRATVTAGRLAGRTHEIVSAFVGGINAGLGVAECAQAKEAEVVLVPWTVADCLAIELAADWLSALETVCGKLGLKEVRAGLGSPTTADALFEIARLARAAAGVAPEVVAGAALGGVGLPGLAWTLAAGEGSETLAGYVARIETPGFAISGLLEFGWPGFRVGCSRTLAFGLTRAQVDDADAVVEDIDGIGSFREGERWERLQVRREALSVRGHAVVRINIGETRNGPLLSSEIAGLVLGRPVQTGPVALRWGARSLASGIDGWLALARAATILEAKQAVVALAAGPRSLGVACVDTNAESFAMLAAAFPLRSRSARGVVLATEQAARWQEVREVVLSCAPVAEGVSVAPRADQAAPLWFEAGDLLLPGGADPGRAETIAEPIHAVDDLAVVGADLKSGTVVFQAEPGPGRLSLFVGDQDASGTPRLRIELGALSGDPTFELVQ